MSEENKKERKTRKKTDTAAENVEKPKRKRKTAKADDLTEEIKGEKTVEKKPKKTARKPKKKEAELDTPVLNTEAVEETPVSNETVLEVEEEKHETDLNENVSKNEQELTEVVDEIKEEIEQNKNVIADSNKIELIDDGNKEDKITSIVYLAIIALVSIMLIVSVLSNKKDDNKPNEVHAGEMFSFTLPEGYYEGVDELEDEGMLYKIVDNKISEAGTFFSTQDVNDESYDEYKAIVEENEFYHKEITHKNMEGLIVRSEEGAEDAGIVLYDRENVKAIQIFFGSITDAELNSLLATIEN